MRVHRWYIERALDGERYDGGICFLLSLKGLFVSSDAVNIPTAERVANVRKPLPYGVSIHLDTS